MPHSVCVMCVCGVCVICSVFYTLCVCMFVTVIVVVSTSLDTSLGVEVGCSFMPCLAPGGNANELDTRSCLLFLFVVIVVVN